MKKIAPKKPLITTRGRGSWNETVARNPSYPCPVCKAMFHGENDVPRHLEDLGDPGLRIGDHVVNIGNRRLSGRIHLIDRGHGFMTIEIASRKGAPTEFRRFQIVAGSGPFKGRPFWTKKES